ncbi:hypothetical protein EVAR_27135_1 [Eumeta japonica]|uniref:Uncharacterized protein n=1 Tax=Eumeta variegata TaxID=151549 RepID=A0A4C1W1I0_EUMVA|nr:hypothetical protein EVAR_27135_1 [Eumeta japonica]
MRKSQRSQRHIESARASAAFVQQVIMANGLEYTCDCRFKNASAAVCTRAGRSMHMHIRIIRTGCDCRREKRRSVYDEVHRNGECHPGPARPLRHGGFNAEQTTGVGARGAGGRARFLPVRDRSAASLSAAESMRRNVRRDSMSFSICRERRARLRACLWYSDYQFRHNCSFRRIDKGTKPPSRTPYVCSVAVHECSTPDCSHEWECSAKSGQHFDRPWTKRMISALRLGDTAIHQPPNTRTDAID